MNPPPWKYFRAQGSTANAVLLWTGMVYPPVDLGRLLSALGIQLEPEVHALGSVSVKQDRAVVRVSGGPRTRQRFVIAHELGHLLLHRDLEDHHDTTFDGTAREREANRFAAELLMPAWMLGPVAPKAQSTEVLQALAGEFQVTPAALSRRIQGIFGVPGAKEPLPFL